jgi:hypothetical protein
MKPGESLFDSFSAQVEASTPRIYSYEETRSLATALLSHARQECNTVNIPRLGHYRIALQRVMNAEGITVPDGRIYKTPSYEDFSIGEQPIDYENRLLLQTNDVDDSKGTITNFIDKVLDDRPKHKGTFVVFGVITPKDVPRVTSVESITFAVVQTNSGEAFGFTFRDNPNKGKIRATEGMSDEWGGIRDRIGYFDTCSIEAVPIDNETMAQVRLELEKAKMAFVDKPKAESLAPTGNKERAQEIGKTVLLKLRFSKKTTTN